MTLEIRKGSRMRAADDRRLDQPLHQHGQPDRKQGLEDDVEENVLQRDHQRVPEQLVVGDLDEVVEADEVRGPEEVVLGQAEVEATDRRIQIEDQEADRGRRDEQQRHSQLAPPGSGLALLEWAVVRRVDRDGRYLDGFAGHRLTLTGWNCGGFGNGMAPTGHAAGWAQRTSSSVLSTLWTGGEGSAGISGG